MLKKNFIDGAKLLFSTRYTATLTIVLGVVALAFATYIAIVVSPSELQLVIHYSAYGMTHLYRAPWWYLLSFALFGLMVAFLHAAIAAKLFEQKGRAMALVFLWFGLGVLLFAWATSYSIINVW